MKRLAVFLVLAVAVAIGPGGCAMLVWKGTEAATGAIQSNESPDQGPVLRGAEEGAGAVHNTMNRVDQAKDAAIRKAENAVTH